MSHVEKKSSRGGWATEASPEGTGIRELGERVRRRCPGPEASQEGSSFRKKGRRALAGRVGGAKGADRTFLAPLASSGTLHPREVAVLFACDAAALSWEMRAAAAYS